MKDLIENNNLSKAIKKAKEYFNNCSFLELEQALPLLWDAENDNLDVINLQGKLDRVFGNQERGVSLHYKAILISPNDIESRLEFILAYLEQNKFHLVKEEINKLRGEISEIEYMLIEAHVLSYKGEYIKSNCVIEEILPKLLLPRKIAMNSLRKYNLYQLGSVQWIKKSISDFHNDEKVVENRFWFGKYLFEDKKYKESIELIKHETVLPDFNNYHSIALLRWVAEFNIRPSFGFNIKKINKIFNENRRIDQEAIGEVLMLNMNFFRNQSIEIEDKLIEELNDLFICPVDEIVSYLISIHELPNMKKIPYYIGLILLEIENKPAEAIEYFEKAVSNLPQLVIAMKKLIVCYEKLSDDDSVLKYRNRINEIQNLIQ